MQAIASEVNWPAMSSNELDRQLSDILARRALASGDYRWRFQNLSIDAIWRDISPEQRREVYESRKSSRDLAWINSTNGTPPVLLRANGSFNIVCGSSRLKTAMDASMTLLPVIIGVLKPKTFPHHAPALSPHQLPIDDRTYQRRIDDWMMSCFGEKIGMDPQERGFRFMEEATELVQSTGMSKEDVLRIVDYVFDRDIGEPSQEIGGTMVCLAALATAHGIDLGAASETELARIWEKADKIKAKHGTKPAHIRGSSSATPADA